MLRRLAGIISIAGQDVQQENHRARAQSLATVLVLAMSVEDLSCDSYRRSPFLDVSANCPPKKARILSRHLKFSQYPERVRRRTPPVLLAGDRRKRLYTKRLGVTTSVIQTARILPNSRRVDGICRAVEVPVQPET